MASKKVDPYLYKGKRALSPSVKTMVRNIVGRQSCGASNPSVIKAVFRKLKNRKTAMRWIKRLLAKEAIKVHKKNVKMYCDVMGGRIR